MRNVRSIVAIGAAIALVAGTASAQQIYKWKDASGVTHYSQTAPASGTHYSKVRLSSGPEVTSNPAAAESSAPAPSSAEANQPRARAASGTQPDTQANRESFCKQITQNIATLGNNAPVIAATSSGKQEIMTEADRKQQIAAQRAQQAQYCKSSGT